MRKLVFALFSLGLLAILTGCGASLSTLAPTQGDIHLTGIVHGGQQPVKGAQILLYSAGKTGNDSAAHSMLVAPVYTDANGFFSLSSGSGGTATYDYSCASSTDQVYIVAVGGDPGVGSSNPSLVMMSTLGNCGDLNYATNIFINEISTVAAAWALAPFMTSYTNVGASATNASGLANAFLNVKLLVDPSTGASATIASSLSVEPYKLYALADVLASCVNSTGGFACGPLFTAATPNGGSAPTDTLTAAINIVKNPGQNPTAVFNVIGPTPPFPSGMTQAPNDWTLTMTVTGGGIAAPTSIAIDSNGFVWVADYFGALSEFSPQGTPLSGASGFGVGALNEAYGLTIDPSNNIWVANEESSPNSHGSITKFLGSSSSTPGAIVPGNGGSNFYDASIDYPLSLSADTNGDLFIGNYANATVTVYNNSGSPIGTGWGSGDVSFPTALAADNSHGVWIGSLASTNITHVDSTGAIVANPSCCYGANGLATDAAGNVWIGNYYGNSFSEVDASGNTLINQAAVVGASYSSYPSGVSVDAGQNVWIANYRGESISKIAGYTSSAPGTVLSPAAGFGYVGPTPAVPLLLLPYAVIPDRSGNLWVSNFGNNNLLLFFGLATPTVTPVQPVPTAP